MNTLDLPVSRVQRATAGRNAAWRDWLGVGASIGCAIHCAAMPFVIAYLPALGLSFLADEAFHKWMALVCFLIAIVAFVPGIRKHGNWIPVSVAATGLVIITFAAFGLAGECCSHCSCCETAATVPATADPGAEVTSMSGENYGNSHAIDEDNAIPAVSPPKNDWLAILTPWITPLGGMLLVSAHLLNRRCGYQCACCASNSPTEQ